MTTKTASVCFSVAALLVACRSSSQQLGTTGTIAGPKDNVSRWAPAIAAANDVYTNEGFWSLVAERSWISSAAPDKAIPGSEVAAALRAVRPIEQQYDFKRFGWGHVPFVRGGTNASTAACQVDENRCGHIFLNIKDEEPFGSLVNTVAHENTHVIGAAVGDGTVCHCTGTSDYAYSDTPDHPVDAEVWMVSYGLGDLAQCFHESKGDREKTWACFDTHVDGKPMDRIAVECSPASSVPKKVLDELRRAAHHCAKTASR